MSLRDDLIEAGAEEMHGDVVGAELVLDAFLDVLAEHADELADSVNDRAGPPWLHNHSLMGLADVLREDA